MTSDPFDSRLVVETEPSFEDLRLLEDRLYEFSAQVTGIADGKLLAVFVRGEGGATIGGAFGWTWGGTCYLRHLFVPPDMRNRGLGTGIMVLVEAEAKGRGCRQIVLETHDFQAPDFYRKLGFAMTGSVADYPRGHQYLTMVKQLAS